jgi:hypothetical protein
LEAAICGTEAPKVGEIVETAVSDIRADRNATSNALDWAAAELNTALGGKCPLKCPVSAKL